ncbi:dihydrolipoamide dehydrogenase [Amycolatopsis bartoniae]|uniref:Dihydrolipoamide dehydrogenase n=1 Tax=Amycolatopsis bartoniae TaxID=941986 RepID=A0A8H9IZG5_9PSEU|nr:NAD(P)/FAD-dependent oxidoreductase [Amycolatopsis bartoniae]MBB2934159.1 dihydrolipoamide dehydrogenase [Amycolatopsis bartoniae]TVT05529.1 NAD(P)/FAD-dependent oxidoreductase [Amycolatopsis bartoniae]GHF88822.1 dihydrolipoamide dehydrogenase [Amycolatopsis bartoniae]
MTEETFDVVVIGGGPVGENAADRAVRGGLRTALVDHERFGGECSYWACIPSKALLRPGNALAAARRLPGVPVGATIDPAKVFERRDSFTHGGDDASQVEWARGAGIDVVRGHARITGEREVTVDADRVLRARHAVVVCTGSVPKTPDIPGLDEVPVWGSREATTASEVPARLAVLGGGVVGVEMAQAWARLGARVDLVVSGPRPLPRYPEFAGDLVVAGLRADGVRVHLDSGLVRASEVDGAARLELTDGQTLTADKLLVATGRRPATDELGLESVGLKAGSTLAVDDTGLVSEVDGGWLYAAGDVTGRAPLTHQGKYAARAVGDVIAAKAAGEVVDTAPWSQYTSTADHYAVPQVVFTDPEVASVGLAAAEEGEPHRVVDVDIAVAGSALHADGYTGKARMVVDTEREVLVGVTFVGQDVAELLHSATIAVVGEVPLRRLWHAVPAFPTMSEVWLRLLETYGL